MPSRSCKDCHGKHFWMQGWRSGESTRLPPMWPGFKSRRHMWVELACEQALCLGKKIARKGKGRGVFPLPNSPLDQRPVHRLGLSLLLVLSLAPRGFCPVFPFPQKPTLPNSNSIWKARTRLNEFIWTLKCFVGKKVYNFFYKVREVDKELCLNM